MNPTPFSFAVLAGGAAFALLAGCAVGPDFSAPTAPEVNAYTSGTLPNQTVKSNIAGGEAQKFALGQDIPAQWWMLFHSEPLNKLVDRALKANPDLQAAKSALREAEENASAGEGAFFPSVDAGAGVNHRQVSGATSGGPASTSIFTLYNASVSVSYVPDIFGGTRRAVELLEAGADFERWQLEAATLTLTANVVTAAIQEASLRAQIAATHEIIDAEEAQLITLQQQLKLGGIAKTDVLAQSANLSNVQATLPVLEKQLAQIRHQLSVLAGNFPAQAPEDEFRLDGLKLPEELPLSLPSKLVEQRPDIKAAEAELHAASAEIGVATANMLPQISLTAGYG
ncbi:MAG: efflux transporter outer membrane subunit, partial [Proteobacteria bacterium]|nr:efflux transporter outer membrane subunit [Pseudomonadota bacterium]